MPVELWSGKIREPDLMFLSTAHASRIGAYLGVPDLAVEILSPGSVYKDREIKRKEYAAAGVVEYWIIDPESRTVDIYKAGKHLTCAGVLTSDLFEDFSMPLAELFAQQPGRVRKNEFADAGQKPGGKAEALAPQTPAGFHPMAKIL